MRLDEVGCMLALADLHTHTSASDGALTPSEVVRAAAEAGLTAVAITDHDTMEGVEEALSAGDRIGIEVIGGIEISTIGPGGVEVHMLGYYLDRNFPSLHELLKHLRESRFDRGRKIVEALNGIGVGVRLERVMEIARGGAVGRPHVARALVEMGAAATIDSAFGKYLVEGAPAFVPRFKVEPAQAVGIIREAGGIAVCAHVAKLNRDELLLELAGEGMRGIEVYHPDHPSVGVRYYNKFAAKHGLIATGGSDAHCFTGGKTTLVGCVTVEYDVVRQLKERLAADRLEQSSSP